MAEIPCLEQGCGKFYANRASLRSHQSDLHASPRVIVYARNRFTVHRHNTTSLLSCPYGCVWTTPSVKRLVAHLNREHPSKDATPEEPAVVEDDSSDQESDSYIEVELPPDAEALVDAATAVAHNYQGTTRPVPGPQGVADDANPRTTLIRSPLLDRIDCDYHPVYCVIICGSCLVAVRHGHLKTHLKEHHIQLTDAALQSLLDTYTLLPDSASVPSPAPYGPPVEGLSVDEGLACKQPSCSYACRSERVMKRHIQQEHQTLDQKGFAPAHVQTFYANPKTYFTIDKTLLQQPADTPYNIFMRTHRPGIDLAPPLISNHPNDFPPILTITQWHTHFNEIRNDPQSRRQLLAALKSPTDAETILDRVGLLAKEYYEQVRDLYRPVEQVVKRILLEFPAPTDHMSGWVPHEREKTLKDYLVPIVRFINFILRTEFMHCDAGYRLPLSADSLLVARQLFQALEAGEATIEHIHALLLSTIGTSNPETAVNRWLCPLVCFLGVLAIRHDGRFMSADDYTQLLARWQYCSRSVQFYQAYQEIGNYDGGLYEAVCFRAERHLTRQRVCPFNTLCEHMAGASAIVYRSTRPPTIVWGKAFECVTYLEKTLYMDKLHKGIQDMIQACRERLTDVILERTSSMDESLSENFTDDRKQHSFLNDAALEKQYLPVLATLMDLNSTYALCDVRNGEVHWKKGNCVTLLTKLDELSDLLSVLCFMLPSQAPRGSEFVDYRLRNSDNLRNVFYSQGLWFANQRLKTSTLTMSYDFIPVLCPKVLERLMLDYLILVRPIQAILAGVCWGDEARATCEEFLFTRHGRRLTSDHFGSTFETLSMLFFAVDLNRRAWRHICIAIKREFIPPQFWLQEGDEVGDKTAGHSTSVANSTYAKTLGSLSNQTSETMRVFRQFHELWHNVLGVGNDIIPPPLEVVRKRKENPLPRTVPIQDFPAQMDQLTTRLEGAVIGLLNDKIPSTINHEFGRVLEMVRMIMSEERNPAAQPMDVDQPSLRDTPPRNERTPRSDDNRMALDGAEEVQRVSRYQSLPSLLHPSDPRYGNILVPATPSQHMEEDAMEWAENVIPRDQPDPPATPSDLSTLPDVVLDTPLARLLANRQEDDDDVPAFQLDPKGKGVDRSGFDIDAEGIVALQMALQTDEVVWWRTPYQRDMVRVAMEARENAIIVLPTGGGKSLCWEVPLQAEKGSGSLTVVMSMFLALTADIKRRCARAGITTQVWKEDGHQRQSVPELMIAAVESIGASGFRAMLTMLRNRVKRTIVDECHLLLIDLAFRARFSEIWRLVSFEHQHLFLTGTLPPRLEAPLKEMCHLPPNTLVIRAPTHRPELAYHVHRVMSDSLILKTIARLAHVLQHRKFDSESWGIIYVTSRVECETLSDWLGIPKYHAGLPEHRRILEENRWRLGCTPSDCWIVATSAFVHGIDKDNVDAVLIAGLPQGMIQFVQASARGGRAGNRRCNVVLVWGMTQRKVTDKDYELCAELNQWGLNTDSCRREGISAAMDGKPIRCADIPNAEFCDVCDQFSDVSSLAKRCSEALWNPVPIADSVDYVEIEELAKRQPSVSFPSNQPLPQPAQPTAPEPIQSTPSEWDPTPARSLASRTRHGHPDEPPSIQSTPLAVSRIKRKETPYNRGNTHVPSFEDLNTLALAAADLPAHGTLPSTPTTLSQLPSLPPLPSAPCILTAKVAQSNVANRTMLAKRLNTSMVMCMRACPFCFALNAGLRDTHPGRLVVGCKEELNVAFINAGTGWIAFKKLLRVPRIPGLSFCYYCGCPIGEYEPQHHKNGWQPAKKQCNCPGADFLAIAFWLIWHTKEYREEFQRYWGTPVPEHLPAWAATLVQLDGPNGFYTGIRVWLQFFDERVKRPVMGEPPAIPPSAITPT